MVATTGRHSKENRGEGRADRDLTGIIGPRIKRFRIEAGLSQEQLEIAAHLADNYVGALEKGVREPRLSTIMKIADALNRQPTDFYDLDISSKPNKDTFIIAGRGYPPDSLVAQAAYSLSTVKSAVLVQLVAVINVFIKEKL